MTCVLHPSFLSLPNHSLHLFISHPNFAFILPSASRSDHTSLKMAQPNYERLKTAAQMFLQEMQCIPNPSVLALANQMENVSAQLAQMQQGNQRFQTEIRDQIKELSESVNNLREETHYFCDNMRKEIGGAYTSMDAL